LISCSNNIAEIKSAKLFLLAYLRQIEKVKQRAAEEGIPYQTLISSIIHKYITGKLVDERAVLKSIELLRS